MRSRKNIPSLIERAWEQELRETLRELINDGAKSDAGLSIIMTLRFRGLFGQASSILLQSLQGPFGRGVILVHHIPTKFESNPERESYWMTSISSLVGDSGTDGDAFLDQFVLALRTEPRLKKMRLHIRVKDWHNRTVTSFLLKFASGALKLVLLNSRGAPLRWEASIGRNSTC